MESSYDDYALIRHRFFFGPGMLRLPRIAHGTIPLISAVVVFAWFGALRHRSGR